MLCNLVSTALPVLEFTTLEATEEAVDLAFVTAFEANSGIAVFALPTRSFPLLRAFSPRAFAPSLMFSPTVFPLKALEIQLAPLPALSPTHPAALTVFLRVFTPGIRFVALSATKRAPFPTSLAPFAIVPLWSQRNFPVALPALIIPPPTLDTAFAYPGLNPAAAACVTALLAVLPKIFLVPVLTSTLTISFPFSSTTTSPSET